MLQSKTIVSKPTVASERRSRLLLGASKKRPEKAQTSSASIKRPPKVQANVTSPSVTPFLKPMVTSNEGVKAEFRNSKEAKNKSQADSLVSQRLMSDFFPKN